MPNYLSADSLAKFAGCEEEDLVIPELDGAVRLRGLTKAEQQDIIRDSTVGGELQTVKIELGMVEKGLVEPKVTPEFMTALLELPSGIFDRMVAVVVRLSGADPEAVREARKRFQEGPGSQLPVPPSEGSGNDPSEVASGVIE